MSAVLKLENLSVSLPRGGTGNIPILDALNLTVGAGEMLALVGESGSGKTIAALAVMRLLPPGATMTGSVRLAGIELTASDERAMRARARPRCRHGVPEPAGGTQPVAHRRRADREAWRVHQGGSAPRGARPGRWSCWARSAFPTRRNGWTITRTSSPAACASA